MALGQIEVKDEWRHRWALTPLRTELNLMVRKLHRPCRRASWALVDRSVLDAVRRAASRRGGYRESRHAWRLHDIRAALPFAQPIYIEVHKFGSCRRQLRLHAARCECKRMIPIRSSLSGVSTMRHQRRGRYASRSFQKFSALQPVTSFRHCVRPHCAISVAGYRWIVHPDCQNLTGTDGNVDRPMLDWKRGAIGVLHEIRLQRAGAPRVEARSSHLPACRPTRTDAGSVRCCPPLSWPRLA